MKKLLTLLTISALAFGAPMLAPAASKKATPAPDAATPAPTSPNPFPYHGDVAEVDAATKTFIFKNKDGTQRLFHVGDTAKITKDGAPGEFSGITVGAYATGRCTKAGEHKFEVLSVKIGPKPEKKTKATPAPKAAATPKAS